MNFNCRICWSLNPCLRYLCSYVPLLDRKSIPLMSRRWLVCRFGAWLYNHWAPCRPHFGSISKIGFVDIADLIEYNCHVKNQVDWILNNIWSERFYMESWKRYELDTLDYSLKSTFFFNLNVLRSDIIRYPTDLILAWLVYSMWTNPIIEIELPWLWYQWDKTRNEVRVSRLKGSITADKPSPYARYSFLMHNGNRTT